MDCANNAVAPPSRAAQALPPKNLPREPVWPMAQQRFGQPPYWRLAAAAIRLLVLSSLCWHLSGRDVPAHH